MASARRAWPSAWSRCKFAFLAANTRIRNDSVVFDDGIKGPRALEAEKIKEGRREEKNAQTASRTGRFKFTALRITPIPTVCFPPCRKHTVLPRERNFICRSSLISNKILSNAKPSAPVSPHSSFLCRRGEYQRARARALIASE